MIPTPAEVEAVLALPAEAKRLLGAVGGLGWVIESDGSPHVAFDTLRTVDAVWLPADSASILWCAAEWLHPDRPDDADPSLDRIAHDDSGDVWLWQAQVWVTTGGWAARGGAVPGRDFLWAMGETARLACIRLVAEVARVKEGKEER